VPADRVLDFGKLYQTNCAGCHGADGKLGPAPPLNDPLFLAMVPDQTLRDVITNGRTVSTTQKTPMPGFGLSKSASLPTTSASIPAELVSDLGSVRQQGRLNDDQIKALVKGIKSHWGPPTQLPESAPSYGGAAAGDKSRGAAVFARACAGCHGPNGQGLERDHQLRRKINDQSFLALISNKELRRYIITGRPDLGMPPYDGKKERPADFQSLTSAQIDDVVALLADWREAEPAKDK